MKGAIYAVTDEIIESLSVFQDLRKSIRTWRIAAGLRAVELAPLIGYQAQTIINIETGDKRVSKMFLSRIRELALEMHKFRGLPSGLVKPPKPPKGDKWFRLEKVVGAKDARWDYCQNPKCPRKGHLQLFLSKRAIYCSKKCTNQGRDLNRGSRGSLPRTFKVRKVLCPHCFRIFPIAGHTVRDDPDPASRQAPDDAKRQVEGTGDSLALSDVLRPVEGGVQSDGQVPDLSIPGDQSGVRNKEG